MVNSDTPVEEIQSIIANHIPDEPMGVCMRAVDEAGQALRRYYDIEVKEGHFVGYNVEGGAGNAYHWYIKLHFDDTDETIIVDPTVQQFTEENYKPHSNSGTNAFVPERHIPSNNVITSEQEIFRAYE